MAAPTSLKALRTAIKTAAATALDSTKWAVLEYSPEEESTYLAWVTVDGVDYQEYSPGATVVDCALTLLDPARPISESEEDRDSLIAPDGALITALTGVDGLMVESASSSVSQPDASVQDSEPVGQVVISMSALIAAG